jgi:hypothetical protein
MSHLKYQEVDEGCFVVKDKVGFLSFGSIEVGSHSGWVWRRWGMTDEGFITANELRLIADELDRRNNV